jgi:hypothetical protein
VKSSGVAALMGMNGSNVASTTVLQVRSIAMLQLTEPKIPLDSNGAANADERIYWPRKDTVNHAAESLRTSEAEIGQAENLIAHSRQRLNDTVQRLQSDIAQLHRLLGQANSLLSAMNGPANAPDLPDFNGRFANS